MTRLRVLINCDDLGHHPSINQGVCEVLAQGRVKSASLLATGSAFDDAIARLREIGVARIGVHLALCSEYPALPMHPVIAPEPGSALVDSAGAFRPEIRAIASRLDLAECERELAAQVEKVRTAGLEISHLDGHMFFYEEDEGGPALRGLVAALAEREGVPFRIRDACPERQIAETLFIWGGYDSLEAREQYYDGVLGQPGNGVTELIIHPARDLEALATFTAKGMRRYADYVYFSGDRFRRLCDDGLQICSWSDV